MRKPNSLRSGTSGSECIRCGTCCEKGGPAFHQVDRHLIEKGRIPSRYLFTIRKGEFAYDNVNARLIPMESDIIKIKGKEDTWTCIFFDEENKQCAIYQDRPQECRALKCWDTRELEKMYTRRRLTREDLISAIEGLWDLVKDHQNRCNYETINRLISDLDGPQPDRARRELLNIIQFDAEIRKLVLVKGGLDSEMLDFVFGRPLIETLPKYGVTIRTDGTKTSIRRSIETRHF